MLGGARRSGSNGRLSSLCSLLASSVLSLFSALFFCALGPPGLKMLPPDTLPPAEMLLALQALNDFWINYLLYKYKHQESPEYPELYAAVRAEALRNLRGDADLTAEQRQVRRCLPGTYQPLKTPLLIHLSAPRFKISVPLDQSSDRSAGALLCRSNTHTNTQTTQSTHDTHHGKQHTRHTHTHTQVQHTRTQPL